MLRGSLTTVARRARSTNGTRPTSTPRASSSSRALRTSLTTSCRPFSEPGAIGDSVPITTEQPEPGGVSGVQGVLGIDLLKTRQAAITKELIEIISGAEAL